MATATTSKIGEVDEHEVHRATYIEPLALNEEFIRLPGDLAYWNARYAEAIENLLTAKRECEAGEAEMRLEYRASTTEKMTEGTLDAKVTVDPRYQMLRKMEDGAEVAKSRTAGVVDAIRAKREMLVSLGAQVRAEMLPVNIRGVEDRLAMMETKLGLR